MDKAALQVHRILPVVSVSCTLSTCSLLSMQGKFFIQLKGLLLTSQYMVRKLLTQSCSLCSPEGDPWATDLGTLDDSKYLTPPTSPFESEELQRCTPLQPLSLRQICPAVSTYLMDSRGSI